MAGLGVVAGLTILLTAERRTRQRAVLTRRAARSFRRRDRDLLSVVAHELRTPLSSIAGWIGVLRSGRADAVVTATALESIASSVRAQQRLVEDIVDAMRAERNQMRLRMEALDLRSPIGAAVDVVRPAAQAANLCLSVALPAARCTVRGDHDRLQQAFGNLLSNAVKFTATGGVNVSLVRNNAEFEVQVVDTGKGIDREFLPLVFNRFEQADRSGCRHGGLGLGLAICRDLIEQHHGRISVESDGAGHGTTVIVTLPALADGGT